MHMITIIAVVAVVAFVVFILIPVIYVRNYIKVPPNEVVFTGRGAPKVVRGGARFRFRASNASTSCRSNRST